MSVIAHAEFSVRELTLARPLHIPGTGAIESKRRAWHLTLRDDKGHKGVGLAAPLPGFSPEGADEVKGALEALCSERGSVLGREFSRAEDIAALVLKAQWPASVIHALEQALIRLLAASKSCSTQTLLGGVDAFAPHHVLVQGGWEAQVAMARGARAIKLKVGSAPEFLTRVREIRSVIGSDMRLHLDANGSWTLQEALSYIPELEALNVALIEEPIASCDLEAMARLRQATHIAIAADESCRDARDLEAILTHQAADAVVLKPMLLGGVLKTRALAKKASEAGLEVLITHCLDGEMGQASALLAASLTPQRALLTVSELTQATDEIINPLASAAATAPEKLALEASGVALSYKELAQQAAGFGASLKAQGIRKGQVVALRGPLNADWVIAFHGIGWIGAIAAPIEPKALPEAQLSSLLHSVKAKALLGEGPTGPWRQLVWPETLSEVTLPSEAFKMKDSRLLLTTSGTTGQPRAIALRGDQLLSSAMGSRERLGHTPEDRWLCALPLHHIGGLSILLRSAFNRTTALLSPRFDPADVANQLVEGSATMVSLVPSMLDDLIAHLNGRTLSEKVRVLLVGGAAIPSALLDKAERLGLPLSRTWGMTEAGSQVASSRPGDFSAGLAPLALSRVSVRQGRLVIEGKIAGVHPLETQDMGWIDQAGRVHVSGRKDRIIISGGENIDAGAIEAALETNPAISEACVVAMEHPHWGQRPGAILVAKDPSVRPTRQSIRKHFLGHMPSYTFPDAIMWSESLAKSALGKVSLSKALDRLKGCTEAGWNLQRGETLHVDTSVNVLSAGSNLLVEHSAELEIERDGTSTEASNADADEELLSETHGALEVSLCVNQGHAPTLSVEDVGEGIVNRDQQGFVSRMTVFKNAPEEGDPSAIDLEKAHGETMFEGHKDSKGRTR